MTEEKHLIGRLIGEAVVSSWRGALDRDEGVAGFDFRDVERNFLAALRAHGMEVVDRKELERAYNLSQGVNCESTVPPILRAMITAATPTAGK